MTWTASRTERAPDRLVARVGEIVTLADPRRSATERLALILDTLDLAPGRCDLDRQRRLVREDLQPEALLGDNN